MPKQDDLATFIKISFRSIWSLEMLLHLWRNHERSWPQSELVSTLRASDSIVAQSVETLGAAGLVVSDADDGIRYAPASADLDRMVAATADFYAVSPGAVRRLIVTSGHGGLTAFADAFNLRKD